MSAMKPANADVDHPRGQILAVVARYRKPIGQRRERVPAQRERCNLSVGLLRSRRVLVCGLLAHLSSRWPALAQTSAFCALDARMIVFFVLAVNILQQFGL